MCEYAYLSDLCFISVKMHIRAAIRILCCLSLAGQTWASTQSAAGQFERSAITHPAVHFSLYLYKCKVLPIES